MTYRENPKTKDKVSILGYGMMRLPTKSDNNNEFDQDMINKQIDYAIEHGLNYFDTSPVYCQGKSEACTGIALSRHKREEYFVATKLSNFHPSTQSREASIAMYRKSMQDLQVDYIDYYLLHAVGGGMNEFNSRYLDNGMMDFLLQERAKSLFGLQKSVSAIGADNKIAGAAFSVHHAGRKFFVLQKLSAHRVKFSKVVVQAQVLPKEKRQRKAASGSGKKQNLF
jgi:predicted aldo/keto reductase-like oxidoreductase